MATGQEQLTRESYLRLISEKGDHELLIEVAMGLYDVKDNCARACEQPRDKRQTFYNATGFTAVVIAFIDGIIIWLQTRSG